MTRRVVAVLLDTAAGRDELGRAMAEDVVDLVAGMQQVAGAVVTTPGAAGLAAELVWPGTPVIPVAAGATPTEALGALAAAGADEAAVVAPDAPDLPPLLLGKLFSALRSAELAVCPAPHGLVAVAGRVPPPAWAGGAVRSFDDDAALDRLRAVAPRRALHVGPGWHRVRGPADLHRLDPGLEGWEATRAYLARAR